MIFRLCIAWLACHLSLHAQNYEFLGDVSLEEVELPSIQTTWLAPSSTIVPGQALTLAFRLDHPKGVYSNSNHHFPSEIEWIDLPAGWTAGPLRFPAPTEVDLAGFRAPALTGTCYLLCDLTSPAETPLGTTVRLKAALSHHLATVGNPCGFFSPLAEEAPAELSLTLRAGSQTTPGPHAQEIANAIASEPRSSPAWNIEIAETPTQVHLDLTPLDGAIPRLEGVRFLPSIRYIDLSAPQQLTSTDTGYRLTLKKLPTHLLLALPEDFQTSTHLGGTLTAKSGWELRNPLPAIRHVPDEHGR